MSDDLETAGGALACMKLGLMHPDNLHPDAKTIVPFVDPATPECGESPDGRHEFAPDWEYDCTGATINCEYCGEPKPE